VGPQVKVQKCPFAAYVAIARYIYPETCQSEMLMGRLEFISWPSAVELIQPRCGCPFRACWPRFLPVEIPLSHTRTYFKVCSSRDSMRQKLLVSLGEATMSSLVITTLALPPPRWASLGKALHEVSPAEESRAGPEAGPIYISYAPYQFASPCVFEPSKSPKIADMRATTTLSIEWCDSRCTNKVIGHLERP
jgi:hypothetical protein